MPYISTFQWIAGITILIAIVIVVLGFINHFKFSNREYRKIDRYTNTG